MRLVGLVRRYKIELLALVLLPVIPAVFNYYLNPAQVPWDPLTLKDGEMSLRGWVTMQEVSLLVDARAPEVYAEGHIPGAINVYNEDFDAQIGDFLEHWEPGLKVVVYCDSRLCGASEEIAERLRGDFEMSEVFVLKGGWEAWQEAKQALREKVEAVAKGTSKGEDGKQ